jgi:hypothetical protein
VRKTLLVLSFLILFFRCSSQTYWQQEANYKIDVSLNDQENTLDGFERIEYINHSPDTLHFIWFHLWPNAYKNDKTAYTDQTLLNGSTAFYFSDKEQKGYINRLDFKVNNITATTEDHPNYIDIIKIILPNPLAPGEKVFITTPFHVKLPFNFSRGGHDGQSYQATQWYPKPAVYDKIGWHPMPYLDQGEFYSEFGSFDVSITLPKNYVVAATGELQNPEEIDWLNNRSTYTWTPEVVKIKNTAGQIKSETVKFPESDKETKTLRYTQNNIHDFAWFADKRFIVNHDTVRLTSGRAINVYTYFLNSKSAWSNAVQYGKRALKFYSDQLGEYPYSVASVVEGPKSFGGGMEYPTITIISPTNDPIELDLTVAHELGHNWLYGILASNEREHPWMDEGMNTYFDHKYQQTHYGDRSAAERLLFETKAVTHTDQPIETSSDKFSSANYDLIAYYKTGEWMNYLAAQMGQDNFHKGMQEYYRRWQFKHPQPEDFKKVLEETAGKDLSAEFSFLNKKGVLPNQVRKGTKITFLFALKSIAEYAKHPTKNLILYSPVVGYNKYDQFMPGLMITNSKLPPSKFQFLIMPMFGTASKKFNGLGFVTYSHYTNGTIRAVDIGVAASRFSVDKFESDNNDPIYLGYNKIVPAIRLTFRQKDPRGSLNHFVQFKTFLIREESLAFYRDTVISGIDTTVTSKYRAVSSNRTLNQLQFVVENNRALYPYRGELKMEQGKDFVRAAFTGNYFFNYPKEGGLNVRLFAGKFFYTSSKTIFKQFSTDRYHLNMTGPNGYEDYTYSDYFVGRNEFEGFASQQIMIRDGAFKVRTDLLADKVGKTDDWLVATNLTTTIPTAINPLSMLPFKVPLNVFADIGTNADAWDRKNDTERFLFDAGLQLSFFKETINVYLPLLYSKVYRDYIQSTIEKKERFIKKISFSINVSGFSLRKFDRNLAL